MNGESQDIELTIELEEFGVEGRCTWFIVRVVLFEHELGIEQREKRKLT